MQVLEKGHQSLLILGKGHCVFGSSDPKISCFGQGLESSRTGRGRGEKEEGGILKTGSLQGQVTVKEVEKEGSGGQGMNEAPVAGSGEPREAAAAVQCCHLVPMRRIVAMAFIEFIKLAPCTTSVGMVLLLAERCRAN